METPLNDHNLLRNMLEDVEPGWEGHVLAGNYEYAEGEGDPDKINTASRLYALWERQEKERREDLSCDTEHAESEEEEQEEEEDNELARRSIVERMFQNVSWDTIGEDACANLYYYALDNGLLAETLEVADKTTTDKTSPILNDFGPVALPRIGKKKRFSKPCPRHRQAGHRAGQLQFCSKPFNCGCCMCTCQLCEFAKAKEPRTTEFLPEITPTDDADICLPPLL